MLKGCRLFQFFVSAFKPRDTTIDARRRRKSIQKNRRYVRMSFRYKKTTQTAEMSLEKSMVAVKTLKGILKH